MNSPKSMKPQSIKSQAPVAGSTKSTKPGLHVDLSSSGRHGPSLKTTSPAALPSKSPHHHHHHHHHRSQRSPMQQTQQSALRQTFKKNIVGDIFGTAGTNNLDGMMYRSRVMAQLEAKQDQQRKEKEESEQTGEVPRGTESVTSSIQVANSDSDTDDDFKHFKTMNPKQQLALTMKNWTLSEDNDHHIISEGGIQALIALCHVEDASIRRCCASSFYNLSNRVQNRQELLKNGATNGVVLCLHGSPPRCTWKVAKLCALTLCNLSMELHGESTMAFENAVGALVQLSTYRGPALLPICIQALYNMTSAFEHFKGIERIIKAFLNISSTSFDHSIFLIRALVNCSRYSWLRLRIIEDGALTCLHSLLPSLSSFEDKPALAFDILTALRSLSDSSGCRVDMLAKGSIDILNVLFPYIDERGKLLTIKILHNFLQASSAMNRVMFENSVRVVVLICGSSTHNTTLQYCSACFHLFTKEQIRGMKHLAIGIIDSMGVLLRNEDPLTQFFAISSSGNLFFNNLCDDSSKVEQLVLNFVEHGPGIVDSAANQALALALAKLSQEQSYMAVIEKLGLLNQVLELLLKLLDMHKDSLLLQESCCIAICRIALRIETLQEPEKQRIADVFCHMLETDDQWVLGSTISGIRALGSSGLCPKQLLSPTLLSRIASIVARYNNILELCRIGCAVLAVFSYDIDAHDMLAAEDIMSVLFANIQAEDGTTRELVATSLCNVSVNSTASNMMIQMGVVEVLATLSSSTSETILELCAKCICNLTCNVTLHPKMMENRVLEIILMISLVRTVSASTKLICAKTLLNLVTDSNLEAMEASGAVRVFATLSVLPNVRLQQICSKGFYLLTLNLKRRQTLISSVPVLQALFNMVKCQSSRTRIRIGTAVCHLLSCPQTNKAAIAAGALSVVKIIATMDFEELREATARVIINLAQDESLHYLLLRQPIVEILVLILQQSTDYTFECAMMAMSCLSQTKTFKPALVDNGGTTALIATIITGKVCTPLVAEEVCRCFCHLSYSVETAEHMIMNGHLILSLQAIYLSGLCSADTSLLVALTIRNLSQSYIARGYIINQGAFQLLVKIITDFTASRFNCTIMYSAMVTLVYNLSLVPELHGALVEQGLMGLLKKICLYGHADVEDGIRLTSAVDPAVGNTQTNTQFSTITSTTGADAAVTATTLTTGENGMDEPGEGRGGGGSNENELTGAAAAAGGDAAAGGGGDLLAGGGSTGSQGSLSLGLPGIQEDGEEEALDAMKPTGAARPSLLYRKDHRKSIIQQAQDMSFEVLLNFTHNEVNFISRTLNLLSQTPSCHLAMVDGGVMKIFKALIEGLSEGARIEVASALANLAASKECREMLVQQSAGELLIALSITSDPETQSQCALALGYLSEITRVNDGVVASLLLLSLNLEETTKKPSHLTSAMIQARRAGLGASAGSAAGGGGGGGGGGAAGGGVAGSAKAAVGGGGGVGLSTGNDASAGLSAGAAATGAGDGAQASAVTGAVAATSDSEIAESNEIPSKTLTNLLKDVMMDKFKFDSYFSMLKASNDKNLDQNSFVPNQGKDPSEITYSATETQLTTGGRSMAVAHNPDGSKLVVNEENIAALQAEESAMLKCEFELYCLETSDTSDTYESESGGMSVNVLMELPLPGIPADRDLEPLNRHDELIRLAISADPLPKDCRVPYKVDNKAPLPELKIDDEYDNDSDSVGFDDASPTASSAQARHHHRTGSGSGKSQRTTPTGGLASSSKRHNLGTPSGSSSKKLGGHGHSVKTGSGHLHHHDSGGEGAGLGGHTVGFEGNDSGSVGSNSGGGGHGSASHKHHHLHSHHGGAAAATGEAGSLSIHNQSEKIASRKVNASRKHHHF